MSAEEPQFSDERFMSADEKRKVLRAWIRFLRNGCQKTQFTHDLYHHLIQHCSFIAHYVEGAIMLSAFSSRASTAFVLTSLLRIIPMPQAAT